MTVGRELVPAVGGTRRVPAPDPIAAEYLLLGLRLDQRIPGFVDGYVGPADLKARVDMEQPRAAAALRDDAIALRDRVATEIDDADRGAWLVAQLTAMETHARVLAGETITYEVLVERSMGFAPPRRDDAVFDAAAAAIDARLPGDGALADRLAAWERDLEVPVDRLPEVVHWLIDRFRDRSAEDFGLPDGEALRISLVRGQPWSAYCWFDGGGRSRIDVNTDLPWVATSLVTTIAHETYPGHHLEHAWKEADLVDRRGWLEASMQLINTPESAMSEGLAELGTRFASPPEARADLLVELFDRAGMAVGGDPARARDVAERAIGIAEQRETLAAARGTAALMRHADARSPDEVLDYLRTVGRYAPATAAKRLEFIEHPLWRTYVFVYHEGLELLRRWLELAPEADRVARFGRLLHEPITPGRVLAELG